jgi:hypothetical protein
LDWRFPAYLTRGQRLCRPTSPSDAIVRSQSGVRGRSGALKRPLLDSGRKLRCEIVDKSAKIHCRQYSSAGLKYHHSHVRPVTSRHGVRLTTFRTWLYRLRRQEAPRAKSVVRVLPVTVVGAGRSSHEPSIDCNGIELCFGADTDPSYIAALVIALCAC